MNAVQGGLPGMGGMNPQMMAGGGAPQDQEKVGWRCAHYGLLRKIITLLRFVIIMSFIEISNLGVHLAALRKHSLHKKGSVGFIGAIHQ